MTLICPTKTNNPSTTNLKNKKNIQQTTPHSHTTNNPKTQTQVTDVNHIGDPKKFLVTDVIHIGDLYFELKTGHRCESHR
jgi:hypothetical protein